MNCHRRAAVVHQNSRESVVGPSVVLDLVGVRIKVGVERWMA